MTSIKSVNNASNIPLASGKTFIGKYDSVLDFSTAVVLVNGDANCELTLYQSSDKAITYSEVFQTVGGTPFTKIINLTAPYCYFTLKNTTGTNMTYLQFEVIYRQVSVVPPAGAVASSVSIFDSNGNNLNSTSGALNVYLTNALTIGGTVDVGNFPATQTVDGSVDVNGLVFDGDNLQVVADFYSANKSGDNLKVSIQEQAQPLEITTYTRTGNIMFNGTVSANGVSNVLSLNDFNASNISVYGNVAGTATIAVQFSREGTNWYTTQYSVSVSASDFGFTIQCASSYVRLKRTDSGADTVINAIAEGC